MSSTAPDQPGGTDKDDNVVVPEPDVEKEENGESDGGDQQPDDH